MQPEGWEPVNADVDTAATAKLRHLHRCRYVRTLLLRLLYSVVDYNLKLFGSFKNILKEYSIYSIYISFSNTNFLANRQLNRHS